MTEKVKTPLVTNAAGWRKARRILCVRLDTMGDVIMTSPAIRALRESGRGRSITLLTSSAGKAAGGFIPEIDDCMVYDCPWMKASNARSDNNSDLEMIKRLCRERFDAAVIFTVYSQNPLPSALLCFLAGIPLRLAHCRENPYQLLTNWVPDPEPDRLVRHEVQRQLDLVATIGAKTENTRMSFSVSERDRIRVSEILAEIELLHSARPWLVIHPGASAASRRYPPENFSAVADHISGALGYQVVFTGDRGERDLVARVQSGMQWPSLSLSGRLSLGELGALLERSPLLLSNNTGPVHIAAALGIPVVDLYALTNPQHTPWAVPSRVLNHDVPCKYCYKSVCPEGHHNCLRLVTPEAVFRAVRDLLVERKGRVPEEGREVRATA